MHLMVSKQYQAAGCRAVSDGTERWLCVLMKGAGVHGRFTDHGRQRFPPWHQVSVQPWHQVFSHVHSLHCSFKTVGVQRAMGVPAGGLECSGGWALVWHRQDSGGWEGWGLFGKRGGRRRVGKRVAHTSGASEWVRRVAKTSGANEWRKPVAQVGCAGEWRRRVANAIVAGEWRRRVAQASGAGGWHKRVVQTSGANEWRKRVMDGGQGRGRQQLMTGGAGAVVTLTD